MKFKSSEILYFELIYSNFDENKGFAMLKRGISVILSGARVHNKGNNILGKSIFGAAKSLNT